MDSAFFIYLVCGVVAVVIGYLGMRTIDFCFTKQEDKRRYNYAKGAIHCYNDGQKRMAMSMVKGINDQLVDMWKKMGDL